MGIGGCPGRLNKLISGADGFRYSIEKWLCYFILNPSVSLSCAGTRSDYCGCALFTVLRSLWSASQLVVLSRGVQCVTLSCAACIDSVSEPYVGAWLVLGVKGHFCWLLCSAYPEGSARSVTWCFAAGRIWSAQFWS